MQVVVEDARKEANAQRARAEEVLADLDRIYEIAGEKALVSDYSKRANADRTAADFWRWAAVGFGLLAVVVTIIFLVSHDSPEGGTDWGLLLTKALAVAAIGGIAAYAVRQSSEHRDAQRDNEHMALQLATVRPYLKDLDDKTRDDLLAQLAPQLFGKRLGTSGSGNPFDQLGPGAGQLVAVVVDVLKAQGQLK
jgi:hypothetical protein